MRRRDIIAMYSSGLIELALAALGFAVIGLIAFQFLARMTGAEIHATGVLSFCWQIAMLMALWPGQTFWTIQRTTPSGYTHSIIGVPSDDDLRSQNRQMARRIRQRLRD